ncbi:MAG: hypothetical protein ACLFR1_12450 [Spirochaetia bacterium]
MKKGLGSKKGIERTQGAYANVFTGYYKTGKLSADDQAAIQERYLFRSFLQKAESFLNLRMQDNSVSDKRSIKKELFCIYSINTILNSYSRHNGSVDFAYYCHSLIQKVTQLYYFNISSSIEKQDCSMNEAMKFGVVFCELLSEVFTKYKFSNAPLSIHCASRREEKNNYIVQLTFYGSGFLHTFSSTVLSILNDYVAEVSDNILFVQIGLCCT